MASYFPRSPRFLKGALVAYESTFLGALPNIIVFQFNPETLTRRVQHRTRSGSAAGQGQANAQSRSAAREDLLRVQGPPMETIDLDVILNAADQLAEPASHPHTVLQGLHPALAALELLLYPTANQGLSIPNPLLPTATQVTDAGEQVPLVLFVWGPSRVVPVQVTGFTVTEQAFDQLLNPIQAKVSLNLQVLTDIELTPGSLAHQVYQVHRTHKEIVARLNLLNSAEEIGGMLGF